MSGYTDGIAKRMSEASMKGEMFQLDSYKVNTGDYTTLLNAVNDWLNTDGNDYTGTDSEKFDQLINDINSGDFDDLESFNFYDNVLTVDCDVFTFIDDNSQGGLEYIVDGDKNLLGARLGVAGEHLGSVSVWLDTQRGVVTQDGESYPISAEDLDALNEALEELFEC